MKKKEYQFGNYYPDHIQSNVRVRREDENYQLLLHSGLPYLENIIYNMR